MFVEGRLRTQYICNFRGDDLMQTAKDVMATDVVTVPFEATVGDAVDILLQNRISGMPVTEPGDVLVGIISEFALLTIAYDPETRHDYVRDHMTTDVISVEEDTDLTKIADTFILHHVRRLPVVRDGKLVGMISRRDVLRAARKACDRIATTDIPHAVS